MASMMVSSYIMLEQRRENGKFYTNGGRVLGITAKGATLQDALDKAYEAVKEIGFDKMHYRTDIGKK